MYNFVHTINNKGVPDTLVLEPFITFRMVAHTIPPVFIDSVKLTPGKHTTVGVSAPQGYLLIKAEDNYYKDLNTIVRLDGDTKTLNVQGPDIPEKYILGKYDVEILTLPRIKIEDVEIKQSYTTTLQIPRPGVLTLFMASVGYGSLYLEKDNELQWVYNINPNLMRDVIVLQPGNYRVVFRAKNVKKSVSTIEKKFKIESGQSIAINITN
jgi:Ca-activated chloride channel homolog